MYCIRYVYGDPHVGRHSYWAGRSHCEDDTNLQASQRGHTRMETNKAIHVRVCTYGTFTVLKMYFHMPLFTDGDPLMVFCSVF
jgi:hypothetical protein